VVVVDPVSNFTTSGSASDAEAMLLRLVDFLKGRGITAMLISLTGGGRTLEATEVGLSSIVDTWLLLRDIELAGERNRGLYILKSRGMSHSNQIREFLITPEGLKLVDVYIGPEGVLTGSMRAAQEDRERAEKLVRDQDIERRQRELDSKRTALEAQIAALQTQFHSIEAESKMIRLQDDMRERTLNDNQLAARARRGSAQATTGNGKRNRQQ
jgi:circadian clock protein KaiC